MKSNALLEPSPWEADAGELIGRDPRQLTADEFREHLPDVAVGLKAMRAKCLDCCVGQPSEIRKCVSTDCALWPFRMGSYPPGLRVAKGQASAKNALPEADFTDSGGSEAAA